MADLDCKNILPEDGEIDLTEFLEWIKKEPQLEDDPEEAWKSGSKSKRQKTADIRVTLEAPEPEPEPQIANFQSLPDDGFIIANLKEEIELTELPIEISHQIMSSFASKSPPPPPRSPPAPKATKSYPDLATSWFSQEQHLEAYRQATLQMIHPPLIPPTNQTTTTPAPKPVILLKLNQSVAKSQRSPSTSAELPVRQQPQRAVKQSFLTPLPPVAPKTTKRKVPPSEDLDLPAPFLKPVIPTITPTGTFLCPVCSSEHTSRVGLFIHLQTHSEETNPFACLVCSKICTSNAALARHLADCLVVPPQLILVQDDESTVDPEKPPSPKAAPVPKKKGPPSKKALEASKKPQLLPYQHPCDHCPAKFNSQRNLERHLGMFHQIYSLPPQPVIKEEDDVEKEYSPKQLMALQPPPACRHCHMFFEEEFTLLVHLSMHHTGGTITASGQWPRKANGKVVTPSKCLLCKVTFCSEKTFRTHLLKMHTLTLTNTQPTAVAIEEIASTWKKTPGYTGVPFRGDSGV